MRKKCYLTKDGKTVEFNSTTAAARFLGLNSNGFASYYVTKKQVKGWTLELGESEPSIKDITGMKFGRLTAIRPEKAKSAGRYIWLCQCDCGNYTKATSSQLKRGVRVSCGCARETHGMSKTRLYTIWKDIKQRCFDTSTNGYHNYGGRGITVCNEWLRFEPFMEWALSHGYQDDLTIDRINVNGNYEPNNCRWITVKEQANNTRLTRYITCDGETHTLSEWSNITGLSRSIISKRLESGWKENEALHTGPIDCRRPLRATNVRTGSILWFESSKDAERHGFSRPAIWRCLTGKYGHHKGYTWEYAS